MKEFKGTKGKWHPVNFAGYICIMDEPFYEAKDILNEDNVGSDIAEANAQLIAAAPELLESLQVMVHLFAGEMPKGTTRYFACKKATSIINKALGL